MSVGKKILVGILGFFGFVVVGIGVLIAVWQWNWFKPVLETQLSRGTGQDIKINGDLHGHLGWITTFEVAGIVATNPNWKGPEEDSRLATIDDVKISIDLKQAAQGSLCRFPRSSLRSPT